MRLRSARPALRGGAEIEPQLSTEALAADTLPAAWVVRLGVGDGDGLTCVTVGELISRSHSLVLLVRTGADCALLLQEIAEDHSPLAAEAFRFSHKHGVTTCAVPWQAKEESPAGASACSVQHQPVSTAAAPHSGAGTAHTLIQIRRILCGGRRVCHCPPCAAH